ncbi:hypothetical protein P3T25_009688 [Paraburkholderia sp. GAS32]
MRHARHRRATFNYVVRATIWDVVRNAAAFQQRIAERLHE